LLIDYKENGFANKLHSINCFVMYQFGVTVSTPSVSTQSPKTYHPQSFYRPTSSGNFVSLTIQFKFISCKPTVCNYGRYTVLLL